MAETDLIRTPDQRVRVFVSSTLQDLAAERQAVRDAVTRLRLVPVMFELGARPHPARQVYRAYLAQSQVFVGIYWQSYGWVASGEDVSGLEDEYLLSAGLPRLIYVKSPAPGREPRLAQMLARIRDEGGVSYQHFSDAGELQPLVENDLAVLLSERFELTGPHEDAAARVPLAGTLPVPATPLVGREADAAAVEGLVGREGVRLVTLTGPGGVGKSRLAVEVADRLRASFADGARFIDLASVRAAELVAAVIAAGLGLSTSGARLTGDVKSYLRGRRLLLVLDNFEQVTEAAPLVADLLGAAPAVVALVTSRMVLRIRGEHEFAVPTLPVPPSTAGGDTAGLLQYASVGLFVERARAAAPGFELTSENAEAVAEICRRLDGLPLAIELAAARVKLLPPQALLSRLGHRLSLLTGGARDLPERQRTLRSTLDWSFGLLSAGEQTLFARLGVFAGTFSLSAVETVGGAADDVPPADPDGGGQVIDTLGSLVDNSLVRMETRGGEPRFRLLETIREYALERLREGADWLQAHDRHAGYFLALAEPTAAELQDRGQLGWLGLARDGARQSVGRAVLARGPGSARASGGSVLGHVEILVAPRPPRGAGRLGAEDRGRERAPAAVPACHGAHRDRLHVHGQRGPGQGADPFRAELAVVPPGAGKAGRHPESDYLGRPGPPFGTASRFRRSQRVARPEPGSAQGGGRRRIVWIRAPSAPADHRLGVELPRADPAQPERSRPRNATLHGGLDRGTPCARPDLHPYLAL